MNGAQQDLSNDLAILIFLDDFLDGISILLPDLMRNEGRVSEHKIKHVVVFLRNELRMVEVILEKVGVVVAKFDVILNGEEGVHRR